MAKPGASVVVTTTLDLSDIERRLTDAEFKVLHKHRKGVVDFIKGKWIGWQYKGRPPGAPRLVSRDAWTSTVSSVENKAAMTITNEATDRGKHYAGYVHRSGAVVEEWRVLWEQVKAQYLPVFRQELLAEVQRTLAVKNPRRIPGGVSSRAAARTTRRVI